VKGGTVDVSQITLRFNGKPAEVHIVSGKVASIQAQLDRAARGSGRAALTNARTGRRFTLELHDVETYSVRKAAL